MKKLIIVVLTLSLLSGCGLLTQRKFPEVPDDLKVLCPALQQTKEDTTKLSDAMTVITNNYSKYHECRAKVESWNDWYVKQKKIFDEVKPWNSPKPN